MTFIDAAAPRSVRPPVSPVRLKPVDAGGAVPPLVLDRHLYVVGNRPGVHLLLPSPVISRTHALLVRDDQGGLYVRDLASRNRVHVNGEPVVEAALVDGDRLGFGPFEFVCQIAATAETAAATGTRPTGAATTSGWAGPSAELRVDGASAVPLGDARTLLVGSRPGCDVCLGGPGVSPAHAVIYRRGDRRFVRDLGQTGGLRVDGQLVREAELLGGEQVVVGAHLLWYVRTDGGNGPADLGLAAATAAAQLAAPSAPVSRRTPANRWPGLSAPAAPPPLAAAAPPPPAPLAAPTVAAPVVPAATPPNRFEDDEQTNSVGMSARAGGGVAAASTPSDGWPWLLTVAAEPEQASETDLLGDARPTAARPAATAPASPSVPAAPTPSPRRTTPAAGDLFPAPDDALDAPAGAPGSTSDLSTSGDVPAWAAFGTAARQEDLDLSDPALAPIIDLWGSSRLRQVEPNQPHHSMSLSVHGGPTPAPAAVDPAPSPTAAAPADPSPPGAYPVGGSYPAGATVACPCCGTRFSLPNPPGDPGPDGRAAGTPSDGPPPIAGPPPIGGPTHV